jgi:hypothetical protein
MTRKKRSSRELWQRFAEDVIVERRRFAPSRWMRHFKRLRHDIEAHRAALEGLGSEAAEGEVDPRELLVRAWCVLMAAPQNTAQHFAGIREQAPEGKGLSDEAAKLRMRGYTMHGLETSPEMQMRWLAALVRAIDGDLAGIDYWPRQGAQWRARDWQVQGYPCFVVPVRRDYRCEDGKERGRRATRYHAIVPAALGELKVELVLHPEVASAAGPHAWTYGAVMFEGMTIDIEPIGDDQFRLSGAPLDGAEAHIAGQVEAALEHGCDALVWPELAVPEDRLRAIAAALSKDPWADARRVPLVVAGS